MTRQRRLLSPVIRLRCAMTRQRRLLSPVIRLRCAMTRQVATDHKAFYVIASWEDGAQIYELVAPSVADRKT
ncbi:Rho guanine nucleotide exchange factor 1 [Lonchura striata]|uniref:Rho guanine nucleotide exchange factor 1 n=1 Tax=Lonchura striata TaxID=40157 RepID=A0A218U8P9_9PASE|nr:Rho guanine nucleotide exchange factor 1 [Lonchura striata domestica]